MQYDVNTVFYIWVLMIVNFSMFIFSLEIQSPDFGGEIIRTDGKCFSSGSNLFERLKRHLAVFLRTHFRE